MRCPRLWIGLLVVVACREGASVVVDASLAVVPDAAVLDSSSGDDAAIDASDDGGIEEMSEKAMRALAEIASVAEANKDCDALGARLEEYYEEKGAFVLEAKAVYGRLPFEEKKVLQKRYRTQFNATWKRLQPNMKKCKDNPSVKAVLDKVLP